MKSFIDRDLAVADLSFSGLGAPHKALWIADDLNEAITLEAREWVTRSRAIRDPIAGLGFTGVVTPNTEPTVAPSAITGGTVEANLYTPATTSNAAWALLPIGVIRAPQAYRIMAAGTITSSGAAQTCGFGMRLGTSATATTNAPFGQTGPISLASTITAPWWFEGHITILTEQPGGTAIGHHVVHIGQQANTGFVGSNSTNDGMSPGTIVATFDSTQQQGVVITVLPSAAGVSVTLKQFMLVAWD